VRPWVNWGELERISGWQPDNVTGAFDKGFDEESRLEAIDTGEFTAYFDARQAASFGVLPTDTVLDAGCGLGRLTLPLAELCERVVALDGSPRRLALVERKAVERGLANVRTLCADWFAAEPGADVPVCDVALGCNSPTLSDVAKLSRAASRRCLYVHSCRGPVSSAVASDLYGGVCVGHDPLPVEKYRANCDYWNSPKNSIDVAFGRLVELGAAPTVSYCRAGWHVEAPDVDALCERLLGRRELVPGREEAFRRNVLDHTRVEEGHVVFERTHTMVVMAWDPQEVRQTK
jgi:SAM-dependent methyltransferase